MSGGAACTHRYTELSRRDTNLAPHSLFELPILIDASQGEILGYEEIELNKWEVHFQRVQHMQNRNLVSPSSYTMKDTFVPTIPNHNHNRTQHRCHFEALIGNLVDLELEITSTSWLRSSSSVLTT